MFGAVSNEYSLKLKGKQNILCRKPHQKVTKLKSKFSLTLGELNRALNNPILCQIF